MGPPGRAVAAGYTNVSVLAVGLKGWKDAGKPVNKV
jgi:rhodanese-related sulfurtransferase